MNVHVELDLHYQLTAGIVKVNTLLKATIS